MKTITLVDQNTPLCCCGRGTVQGPENLKDLLPGSLVIATCPVCHREFFGHVTEKPINKIKGEVWKIELEE